MQVRAEERRVAESPPSRSSKVVRNDRVIHKRAGEEASGCTRIPPRQQVDAFIHVRFVACCPSIVNRRCRLNRRTREMSFPCASVLSLECALPRATRRSSERGRLAVRRVKAPTGARGELW